MKSKIIFFYFITLITSISVRSQSLALKPLTVGDAVPDITFGNLVNYPTETVKLSDFRGKLLILDFWATWCGSCIAEFPKTQELQNDFKKDVQFLLVADWNNGDNMEKIKAFLDKQKRKNKELRLPITIDSITSELFPHTAIPRYVWIDKNGKVLTVTGAEDVTADNIREVLEKGYSSVKMITDFDKRNLYYLDTTAPLDQLAQYTILVKGRMTNLNGGGGFQYIREKDNNINGYFFANESLYGLYTRIASLIVEDFDNDFARIQVDTVDHYFIEGPGPVSDDLFIKWANENSYTLDVYSPHSTIKELFYKSLQVLNSGTPFTAVIEKQRVRCLVLRRIDSTKESGSEQFVQIKYENSLRTVSLPDIKSMIRADLNRKMPLVDRTGFKGYRYFEPKRYPTSIEEAKKILAQNNIKISEEFAEINVMKITRKVK